MSNTIPINTTTGLAHCWPNSTLYDDEGEVFPPEYADYKCQGMLREITGLFVLKCI